jgi:hypothetical protein
MRSIIKATAFAGILAAAFATAVPAAEPDAAVPERQPVVTVLSATASAMTFWMIESDGWRVVTIVDMVILPDSDAEQHAVVRFSSVLLPGQSQLISVPLALGEREQILRISRIEDQIQVERIPGV